MQIDFVVDKRFSVSTKTELIEPISNITSHFRLIGPQNVAKLNAIGSRNPPALPEVSYVGLGSTMALQRVDFSLPDGPV